MSQSSNDRSRGIDVGQFLVAGAGFGAVVFAITGNALWIGIGTALGIFVAGILDVLRSGSSDTEGDDRDG